MNNFLMFLIPLIVINILVILTWLYAIKIKNFSIIDSVWSYSFFIHATIFYFLGDGFWIRKLILSLMLGIWSLRLGTYLTKRIYQHHPLEDSRYLGLRAEYGENFKFRFFLFFLMQAFSVSLLTFPFIHSYQNKINSINNYEILGASLWFFSLIGESIADKQIHTFRINPKNHGEVCNIGLWKYSRHPNYFFESLIWWGYFLTLMGTDHLWWGIYSPLIILFLLLKVTGVPPSEVQSLKSRGEKYRRYQEKTSMFIPWFPK